MEGGILGDGLMESNMVEVLIFLLMALKEKENGIWEKELDGLVINLNKLKMKIELFICLLYSQ